MNIDSLTIGEIKQLAGLFQSGPSNASEMNDYNIGKSVIIRTYSAGVWFGTIEKKAGKEVILSSARRMWQWKAKKSISLSAIVVEGIDQENSRIAPAVRSVWLEAIEILPIEGEPEKSIKEAKNADAR